MVVRDCDVVVVDFHQYYHLQHQPKQRPIRDCYHHVSIGDSMNLGLVAAGESSVDRLRIGAHD